MGQKSVALLSTADHEVALDELVHIVDDDPQFRDGLSLLLRGAGFNVRIYPSAERFLATFQPSTVECLLVDLRMPGMSGLDLQNELIARHFKLPIILISAFAESTSVVQAVKNGALDFLEKPVERDTLVAKVRATLDQVRLEQAQDLEINLRLLRLTPRERQVLESLLAAKNTVEMARIHSVSTKTIEKHRVSIFEKMGVDSVPELMRLLLGRYTL